MSLSVRERGFKQKMAAKIKEGEMSLSVRERGFKQKGEVAEKYASRRSLYESVDLNYPDEKQAEIMLSSLSVRERGFKQCKGGEEPN